MSNPIKMINSTFDARFLSISWFFVGLLNTKKTRGRRMQVCIQFKDYHVLALTNFKDYQGNREGHNVGFRVYISINRAFRCPPPHG